MALTKDDSETIKIWIKTLHNQRLLPDFREKTVSFQKHYTIKVLILGASFLRYGFLMFVGDNRLLNLLFGGIFHAFGLSMWSLYFCASAVALIVMTVYAAFSSRLKIVQDIMAAELLPYLSCNTPLRSSDSTEKFLKRLRFTHRVTKAAAIMGKLLTTLVTLFVTILCAANESSVFLVFLWFFWTLTHLVFAWLVINTFWTIALWFVLNTHLTLQVDQLTQSIVLLDSSQLNTDVIKVFKSYKQLSLKIKNFNRFSKQLLCVLTAGTNIISTILLHGFITILPTSLIIGLALIDFALTFLVGSLAVLNISSSIFMKNQKLYRSLNSVFVRRTGDFSVYVRYALRIMIKNTGSRNRTTLALVNIDDRIYDRQLLGRYIYYSIRLFAILAKFSKPLHFRH